MKNTIENKIDDESNVIEQRRIQDSQKLKNTIDNKFNDESDVIEQKDLGLFKVN